MGEKPTASALPVRPKILADLAFDTCAVRELTRLSSSQWSAFVGEVRGQDLTVAWIPWVINEITGSNLMRRHLDSEGLAELQHAASRYDTLCQRRILPQPGTLMCDVLFELAGADRNEPSLSAEGTEERRRLDRFFCLTSPDSVQVTKVEDGSWVSLKRDSRDSECAVKIPTGFVKHVDVWVDRLRTHKEANPDIDRSGLAWVYFREWVPRVIRNWELSDRISLADLGPLDSEGLAATSFGGGLVEGWYLAGRVLGLVKKKHENDAIDIAIASYLSVVKRLVMRDRRFGHMMRELLIDSSRIVPVDEILGLAVTS